MSENTTSKNNFGAWKIVLPSLIGLLVVGWMFYREFDASVFLSVDFGWKAALWLCVAVLCMVWRDLGYVIRIRILSENQLSWLQSLRVIMLWEFTSAITPSAVGGTSVALLYVHKEGLSVGRSSAIVMLTSFFDELYFVLMMPLVWLLVGERLFEVVGNEAWGTGLFWVAVLGYSFKTLWTLALGYGLFINPRGLSRLVYKLFHLPFLRRWKRGAARAAVDIVSASREMKGKPMSYWLKVFLSTVLSWTGRYWVVNALLLMFFLVNEHFLIFARQLVMWIALLVSPTPGGSGIAEYMFGEFLGEFVPISGFAVVLALLWRLISYYPYLVVGALLVPKWLSDNFKSEKKPISKPAETQPTA